MKNIYNKKNTTCFIFTGRIEGEEFERVLLLLATEEYTLKKKEKLETICNRKQIFKRKNITYSNYFFIDSQDRMKETLEELYKNKEVKIKGIIFKIPPETKGVTEEVKGLKMIQYYKIRSYKCEINNFWDELGFYLVKDNLDKEIENKIEPRYFIEPSTLKYYIDMNCVMIYKELFMKYKLRGQEVDENNEVKEIRGFILFDNYNIEDTSLYLNNRIKADLDKTTGKFAIKVPYNLSGGEIFFYVKKKLLYHQIYNLMMNLKLKLEISGRKIKLFSGEEISVPGRALKDNDLEENRIYVEKNKSFYIDNYQNIKDYKEVIRECIKQILCDCAPNIMVADPYFLGEVKKENVGIYLFMDALILAMLEYKIKNLYLLGNKFNKKCQEGYEILFEKLKEINPNLNVEILNYGGSQKKSKLKFHDRTILRIELEKNYSYIKDKIRIFRLGTSINTLGSGMEFNLFEITDEAVKVKNYATILERAQEAIKERNNG